MLKWWRALSEFGQFSLLSIIIMGLVTSIYLVISLLLDP